MACPDPRIIAELDTPDGNPEVIKHLQECSSCRLDWQIVHCAHDALYPDGEVRHDLNQHVMARIAQRARAQERPSTGWEHCVSGILVSVATGAFLLASPNQSSMAPVWVVFACAVLAAVIATLFFRWQDASPVS